MLEPMDPKLLERKVAAGMALTLSLACLKLELPEAVWQDHADAIREYFEADNGIAAAMNQRLAYVQERVGQLVEALPA